MNNLLPCPFCGGEFEIITGQFAQGSAVLFHGAHMCNVLGRQISTRWCNAEKDVAEIINCRAQPSEKPEPLTLGELRQMGGEPIWIKEFPPYAFAGYKVLSLRVVDVYGDIVCEDGDIYEYERYGKTWLAYRAKPKEEHHEDD